MVSHTIIRFLYKLNLAESFISNRSDHQTILANGMSTTKGKQLLSWEKVMNFCKSLEILCHVLCFNSCDVVNSLKNGRVKINCNLIEIFGSSLLSRSKKYDLQNKYWL